MYPRRPGRPTTPTTPVAVALAASLVVEKPDEITKPVEPVIDWRALAIGLMEVVNAHPFLTVEMMAAVNAIRAAAGLQPRSLPATLAPQPIGRVMGGTVEHDPEPAEADDDDRIGDVPLPVAADDLGTWETDPDDVFNALIAPARENDPSDTWRKPHEEAAAREAREAAADAGVGRQNQARIEREREALIASGRIEPRPGVRCA